MCVSLSITFLRLIRIVACLLLRSFLFLNDIPVYGYSTFCLSIPQLINIWLDTSFLLPQMILLWILVYTFLCGHRFSFLLGVYLGVGFHMVNYQTVLSVCSILQSYQQCMRVPISPYSSQHLLLSILLILVILAGVKHFIVVLHFHND